jgi:metal-responsive CopG/Arc/MetJ family transcriptional regulator
MTMTEERRLVSAWIEPTLADKLDQAPRLGDRSRSAQLRIALRQYFAQGDVEEPQPVAVRHSHQ